MPHVKPTDVIYQFLFDEKTGKLTPNKVPKIVTDPGHGPRHYAFHPTLNVVYFNEEQVSRVAVYRLDSESGTLDKLQSISTLPEEGFAGDNSTASVRVHPSGKAVYVPNRGHDSIAVFAADSATGLLSSLGHVDSEAIPRPVGIAPDGDLFFAGSDTTGRLSTYRINAQYMLEPLDVYDLGMWVAWILPVKFT